MFSRQGNRFGTLHWPPILELSALVSKGCQKTERVPGPVVFGAMNRDEQIYFVCPMSEESTGSILSVHQAQKLRVLPP